MSVDILSFRCIHRHTAESHPRCWERYQKGETKSLQVGRPRHTRPAKILLIDIETLPGEYYPFDPKVEYLSPDKKIKGWSIACWGAKWLFDKDIMGEHVTAQEATDRKEGEMLENIRKLLNEAQLS